MKMKSVFIFLLGFSLFATAQAQQAYIKIGEAQSKKSNLAFPPMNNLSGVKTSQHVTLATEIFNTAKKDLELSTYFNVMSQAAFLENTTTLSIKPKSNDSNGFAFETWKAIGADFLIRSSISIVNNDMTVEMFLYQVDQSKTVVGKKYQAKTDSTVKIGHILANDILEALTGKRGAFLSKIIATTDRTGHKEVLTMNWDGLEQKVITRDRSVAISPNWSPDGNNIIYSIYTRRIRSAQMNLTLFQHNLNTGKRSIISNRNGLNSGGTYSPDGRSIYLTISQNGAPDIYKLNLQGEVMNRLTKGPAGAMNVEAALSKDGSRVAFSSDRGGNPAIYSMSADGSGVKRLTFQGKYNSSPTWSPDGQKIVFASQIDKYFDIFSMNSDGSDLKRLTTAYKPNGQRASNEDPSFSADGRFIVFTSNRSGKFQIYAMSADGKEERRVTQDSYNYYKPKWSNNLE